MRKFSQINEEAPREKINLSHLNLNGLVHEDTYLLRGTDFELVEVEKADFDGEKGYVSYDIIIKRISDGKFFKGWGEDWGRGEYSVDSNFSEVYPKQITKTIYT